jgi:4-carboxymuconolactone decarboxylase
MTDSDASYQDSLDNAERLLGFPWSCRSHRENPRMAADFRRLATETPALVPWSLRGQLRIALDNGVTKEEIVEAFIHIEAYAGAARAFEWGHLPLAGLSGGARGIQRSTIPP